MHTAIIFYSFFKHIASTFYTISIYFFVIVMKFSDDDIEDICQNFCPLNSCFHSRLKPFKFKSNSNPYILCWQQLDIVMLYLVK